MSLKHASIFILTYCYSTSANGADNASSNGPLNGKQSKHLWKASGYHIDVKNMQIGFAGHGLNIRAQSVLPYTSVSVRSYQDVGQFSMVLGPQTI